MPVGATAENPRSSGGFLVVGRTLNACIRIVCRNCPRGRHESCSRSSFRSVRRTSRVGVELLRFRSERGGPRCGRRAVPVRGRPSLSPTEPRAPSARRFTTSPGPRCGLLHRQAVEFLQELDTEVPAILRTKYSSEPPSPSPSPSGDRENDERGGAGGGSHVVPPVPSHLESVAYLPQLRVADWSSAKPVVQRHVDEDRHRE